MNGVGVGADNGLGEAVAKLFLEKGHKVGVGLYSGDEGSGTSWEKDLHENALLFHTDVCNEETLKRAAKLAYGAFGPLDSVIVAAGILSSSDRVKSIIDCDLQDLREMFDVNALGIISVFRSFYQYMKKDRMSKFIAVTAAGGVFSEETSLFPGYHISKTAANKLVQILKSSIEDISVLALHPGRVNTEMGRTTAQIEPEESASGIYRIVAELTQVPGWFIDYKGNALKL